MTPQCWSVWLEVANSQPNSEDIDHMPRLAINELNNLQQTSTDCKKLHAGQFVRT